MLDLLLNGMGGVSEMEYMESMMQNQHDAQNQLIMELDETRMERDQLKAERDALAAQVERLQYYITKYQELGAEFILTEALTKTPRQCLRDVRAEAGVKGLRRGVALASGGDISLDSILVKIWSDGYAESVRQGGAE